MEYSNRVIREVIGDCIHLARDREILCSRLIDGTTIEKLAEIFDMSTSQIKRIIRKNEPVIFRNYPK